MIVFLLNLACPNNIKFNRISIFKKYFQLISHYVLFIYHRTKLFPEKFILLNFEFRN